MHELFGDPGQDRRAVDTLQAVSDTSHAVHELLGDPGQNRRAVDTLQAASDTSHAVQDNSHVMQVIICVLTHLASEGGGEQGNVVVIDVSQLLVLTHLSR